MTLRTPVSSFKSMPAENILSSSPLVTTFPSSSSISSLSESPTLLANVDKFWSMMSAFTEMVAFVAPSSCT
ncbi:Uncharacterised protein [Segatella copri]|nr:Uncharacterised protein [Segatella copri]